MNSFNRVLSLKELGRWEESNGEDGMLLNEDGSEETFEAAVLGAVDALGLLDGREEAERELAALLRETCHSPKQRDILLTALRCCARLPIAEPFLEIEKQAREYAAGVRKRGEDDGRRRAEMFLSDARMRIRNAETEIGMRERELAQAQADCERRKAEMMGPNAPAIVLLQSVLSQYPVQRGERLPPTAFLSACALVASLMGTNPVDLALNLSGGNFEFSNRK